MKPMLIRLDERDIERLRVLVARIHGAKLAAVIRAAIRLGLDALEADPRRMVEVKNADGR